MNFEKAINEDKEHRYIVFEKMYKGYGEYGDYVKCFMQIYGVNKVEDIHKDKISLFIRYEYVIFDKEKEKLMCIDK